MKKHIITSGYSSILPSFYKNIKYRKQKPDRACTPEYSNTTFTHADGVADFRHFLDHLYVRQISSVSLL